LVVLPPTRSSPLCGSPSISHPTIEVVAHA